LKEYRFLVEFAPDARTGRHTHPGDEIDYVLEGQGELLIDGQPAKMIKAGDASVIPGGPVHDAHNTGRQPMKVPAVMVVEKGKPITAPAN
jgi:quercetin dioxygenase-like cupin family protein